MIRRWSTRTYGIAMGGTLMLGCIAVSQMLAGHGEWLPALIGSPAFALLLVVTEDMPGRYDTELLDVMLAEPGHWWYAADLCDELGWRATRVVVTLRNLEQRNLVRMTWSTNRRIYSAVSEGA